MLTELDWRTVGASYWLHLREDKTPIIAAIERDTGLSRKRIEDAIKHLEGEGRAYLDECRELVAKESPRILVNEAIERARLRLVGLAGQVISQSADKLLALNARCQEAALVAEEEYPDGVPGWLKLMQYETMRGTTFITKFTKAVAEVEAAIKATAPTAIGQQTIAFNLQPEEKIKLADAIQRTHNRLAQVNGN